MRKPCANLNFHALLIRKSIVYIEIHFPKHKLVEDCFELNNILKIIKNDVLSNATGITKNPNVPF